ncbi:MAG: LuxR C-terminal-related transcriptional regulator, partial [Anaerolineae bacterium]
ILARLALAQGKPETALVELQPLIDVAERRERTRRLIELLALAALALDILNREADALDALRRSLVLAAPEGYIRTFLDEGPQMQSLLADLLESTTDTAQRGYTRQLLLAFADEGYAGAPQAPLGAAIRPQPLVEPLSDREIEVLQLIAKGYTNREIGEALYIALNTVKGHTREIYGKLGVHSRTQAVVKARALGILPQG